MQQKSTKLTSKSQVGIIRDGRSDRVVSEALIVRLVSGDRSCKYQCADARLYGYSAVITTRIKWSIVVRPPVTTPQQKPNIVNHL